MQLPFVLQSAETMKAAVSFLEPYMEKSDQGSKGTVVLATVRGDVHDIGKNLVDIILTNNGYQVVNLGIKVPIADMVNAVAEHKADAIGARRVDDPRPVQRVLRPQPGGTPGAQLRVPARVRAGRARLRDRARLQDPAARPHRRPGQGGLPRPRLRPPHRRLRPSAGAAGAVRGREGRHRAGRGPQRLAGRPPAVPAHHRRQPQRPRGRPDRGARGGDGGAGHRQRHSVGRHEGGGRALRLGRDAAPLRPAIGRDDEGGRRVPRTAHGEVGPGRQGHRRAGDRQGRRARHREEPGRHHPHQQRLRGDQPRDQDRHQRDGGRGRGAPGRRHRHERPAGQVDADHAREPGRAERPLAVEHSRAAGRRGVDPHLCRARPARGLRRPALLRARRLRGVAHHGPPGGAEEERRGGPVVRTGDLREERAAAQPAGRPGDDTRGGAARPGRRGR